MPTSKRRVSKGAASLKRENRHRQQLNKLTYCEDVKSVDLSALDSSLANGLLKHQIRLHSESTTSVIAMLYHAMRIQAQDPSKRTKLASIKAMIKNISDYVVYARERDNDNGWIICHYSDLHKAFIHSVIGVKDDVARVNTGIYILSLHALERFFTRHQKNSNLANCLRIIFRKFGATICAVIDEHPEHVANAIDAVCYHRDFGKLILTPNENGTLVAVTYVNSEQFHKEDRKWLALNDEEGFLVINRDNDEQVVVGVNIHDRDKTGLESYPIRVQQTSSKLFP